MKDTRLKAFTLNVKKIEGDDLIGVQNNLKHFLVEGHNPILEEIEQIYIRANQLQDRMDIIQHDPRFGHGSPGMEREYKELRAAYKLEVTDRMQGEISSAITSFLISEREIDLLAEADTDVQIGDSNSAMKTHLAFVLQKIKVGRDVTQIMDGYTTQSGEIREGLADRIMDQYLVTDFNRMKIKVIDQKGRLVTDNLNQSILRILEAKHLEPTKEHVLAQLKESLNLSDQQLKFVVSRYNQRDIQSVPGAVLAPEEILTGAGESVFHVNAVYKSKKFQITKLKSVEYNYSATRPEPGKVHIDNFGNETVDFDPNKAVPSFQVSYKVDVSNLTANDKRAGGKFIALPTGQPRSASLTFEAKVPEAEFMMPEHLMHRVTNAREVEIAPRDRAETIDLELNSPMKRAIDTVTRGLRSVSFASTVENDSVASETDAKSSPISFLKQRADEAVRALRSMSIVGVENIAPGNITTVSPDAKASSAKSTNSGKSTTRT